MLRQGYPGRVAQVSHTDVVWTCRECGQPVLDGGGYVEVSRVEAQRVRDSALAEPDGGDLAHWTAVHSRCNGQHHGYGVAVEGVRTFTGLAVYTADLVQRAWFHDTDWLQVLGEAAGARTEQPQLRGQTSD
ncbi:MAG: hypothetical protein ACRDQA_05480 [Nocardioidaceae bacterium]